MNLQHSIEMEKLRLPVQVLGSKAKHRSKLQVARRVFELAANGGFPYMNSTPEKWADKWLSSDKFVLTEININAAASININVAASPHAPKNPNRVEHYMHCSVDSMDPILVDLNKRKQGMSYLGYVPEVIVLDGKHRKRSQIHAGRTKIWAWVGEKALKRMPEITVQPLRQIKSANVSLKLTVDPTRMSKTYELYAATIPSVGAPVVRQDSGEGGSRPKDHLHSGKIDKKEDKSKVKASRTPGARSTGQLDVEDASDTKIPPDSSDVQESVEASDRRQYTRTSQLYAPGTRPGYSDQFGSPNFQAPGSGVGQRVINRGASNSDFSRAMSAGSKDKLKAKSRIIKKMKTKKNKNLLSRI